MANSIAKPEFNFYLDREEEVQITFQDGDSNAFDFSSYDSHKAVHKSGYDRDTQIQELTIVRSGSNNHIFTITLTQTQLDLFDGKTHNVIEIQHVTDSKTLPDIFCTLQITLYDAFEGTNTTNSATVSIDDNTVTATITSGKVTDQEVKGVFESAKGTIVDGDKFAGFDSENSDDTVTWLWSVIKSTFKTYYDSVTSTLTNKTLTAPIETVNALGSISGSNDIDVSQGTIVTATLTGSTTLTFSGNPGSNEISFVLKFSGAETISWPANTIFAGGEAPSITGPDYEIPCSIDSSGVVTVHGIIDEYATV